MENFGIIPSDRRSPYHHKYGIHHSHQPAHRNTDGDSACINYSHPHTDPDRHRDCLENPIAYAHQDISQNPDKYTVIECNGHDLTYACGNASLSIARPAPPCGNDVPSADDQPLQYPYGVGVRDIVPVREAGTVNV